VQGIFKITEVYFSACFEAIGFIRIAALKKMVLEVLEASEDSGVAQHEVEKLVGQRRDRNKLMSAIAIDSVSERHNRSYDIVAAGVQNKLARE